MHRYAPNASVTAIPAAALITLACLFSPTEAETSPEGLPQPHTAEDTSPGRVSSSGVLVPSSWPEPIVSSSETLEAVANADRAAVLQGDGTVRVEVKVRATQELAREVTVPTDLIVVLDRSGSMSDQKLTEAKTAASELLAQLDPADRFAMVSYASTARLDISLTHAVMDAKQSWQRQIDQIEAMGGTNMQQGLIAGEQALDSTPGRAQRMILISDGLPDTQAGLLDHATLLAQREVPLTTVGIGLNYDEQLMAAMADAGTGNFYWVQGSDDMAATFAAEFHATREMVASGLTVAFQPDSHQTALSEAAGYTLTTADGFGSSFSAGPLFHRQERTLWLTFSVDTAELGMQDLGQLQLQWRDRTGEMQMLAVALPAVRVTVDDAQYLASFDIERWSRGVVDESYNRMRVTVSDQVQKGDKDAALALIDAYTADTAGLNNHLGSDDVQQNLAAVETLRQEVEANFTGADQRSRQNHWSKWTNVSAYQSRRGGQYR